MNMQHIVYHTRDKRKKSKDKTDKIVSAVLKSNGNCYIVGSYIYKHKIRGEKVNDVDCVCEDYRKAANELVKTFNAKPKVLDWGSRDGEPFEEVDYSALTIGDIKVDLINKSAYERLNENQNSMINNIQMSNKGIEQKNGDRKQLEFIIYNLRNGNICKWLDMRQKDKKYFRDFNVIPEYVCEKNGL